MLKLSWRIYTYILICPFFLFKSIQGKVWKRSDKDFEDLERIPGPARILRVKRGSRGI